MKKRPNYYQRFGIWLNESRIENKKTHIIANGVAIGMGFADPGIGYFRSICNGEDEAIVMKAQYDMARQMRNREQ